MRILLFGQLADIFGNHVLINPVSDTDALVKILHENYPELDGLKYIIALDKKVITSNQPLHENSVIALMPPFSGG